MSSEDVSRRRSRRLPVPEETEIRPPAPEVRPIVRPKPSPKAEQSEQRRVDRPKKKGPTVALPPAEPLSQKVPDPSSRKEEVPSKQQTPTQSPKELTRAQSAMLMVAATAVALFLVIRSTVREEMATKRELEQQAILQRLTSTLPDNAPNRETGTPSLSPQAVRTDSVPMPEPVRPPVQNARAKKLSAIAAPAAIDVHSMPLAVEPSWTTRSGFPFLYGSAKYLLERAQEEKSDHFPIQKEKVRDYEQQMAAILSDAQSHHGLKTTRLMVLETTPEKVVAISDVTAGWLILDDASAFRPIDVYDYDAGIMWLVRNGDRIKPTIELEVGKDIDPEVARTLVWGDRIDVAFMVVGIEASVGDIRAGSKVKFPSTIARISHLKCLARKPREVRSNIWPDDDTFPNRIVEPMLDDELLALLIETLPPATARLRINKVTATEVVLDNELYTGGATIPIRLRKWEDRDDLSLQLSLLWNRGDAPIKRNDEVLVSFSVRSLDRTYVVASEDFPAHRSGFALAANVEGFKFVEVVRKRDR